MAKSRKPVISEELSEKRKNQILEAAIQVFSKKGFEGSTTKEIAKKAKVSEGTIFRYFKTKKEILIHMLNILSEQTLFDFVEQIESGLEPQEAIKSLLKRHYRFIVNNQDLIKILVYEVQFHKDLKEKFYNDVLNRIIEFTTDIISEIMPDSKIPPRTIAENLMAIFLGLTLVHTFKNSKKYEEQEKVVSDTIRILVYGIKDMGNK
ncbi:MAG: TetR/AcrR family transcriptional regulator [Tepidanaerobacter acetatoxydans]|uniref:TetR/AcrR family transcriptional regulator n=1 Tax=Tepidanaerobacter acetatoxydans TaxID=499229 RepID=UPI0026EB9866|nr:TetR/AcrR family transcriptional regulator [Tepidanaerobacter acetatoxydans]NLU10258.1 TetR/AcrR family transcriptional regulator [Tepidanaerobacter acetatoxydans]